LSLAIGFKPAVLCSLKRANLYVKKSQIHL